VVLQPGLASSGITARMGLDTMSSTLTNVANAVEGSREIQEYFLYFKEKLEIFLGRLSEENSDEEHENDEADESDVVMNITSNGMTSLVSNKMGGARNNIEKNEDGVAVEMQAQDNRETTPFDTYNALEVDLIDGLTDDVVLTPCHNRPVLMALNSSWANSLTNQFPPYSHFFSPQSELPNALFFVY